MQPGITGHDCPAKGPRHGFLYQFGADRIREDVKADFGKGVPFPFFFAQDVIMCLMLKAMRSQRRSEMFAQEFHAIALVRIQTQPHPEQVDVVGHQAINRAEQTFTGGGVKHDFSELRMKPFVQPAHAAQSNGHCPVDDRVTLIIFAGQSREEKAAVRALAGKAFGSGGGFAIHLEENRAGSRRLPPFCSIRRQPDHSINWSGLTPAATKIITLIIFAGQSREIKAAVRALAGKAFGCGGGFAIHLEENRAGSRRLPPFCSIRRQPDHSINWSGRTPAATNLLPTAAELQPPKPVNASVAGFGNGEQGFYSSFHQFIRQQFREHLINHAPPLGKNTMNLPDATPGGLAE